MPKHFWAANPIPDGITCVFRDLELHRPVSLALDDRDAVADPVSDNEFGNLQTDEITAAQLAVDRKVEQRQISEITGEFEPGADGPDLLWEQRTFLPNKPSLVPRVAFWINCGK